LHQLAIYGRYEYVQKDVEELALTDSYPLNPNFTINSLTLGINHLLTSFGQTNLTGGIQSTLNISPVPLRDLYGTAPISVEVYIRVSPSVMMMGHKKDKMQGMSM
jgi:hypothetical protein